jgi:hypothetical protein
MKRKHLCADATYKLVWQGFPVLLCGTTDSKKQFHPFSINICTNETEVDYEFMFTAIKKAAKSFFDFDYRADCLIADAAPAIHNGFMNAFQYTKLDEFMRIMCWSHVERLIDCSCYCTFNCYCCYLFFYWLETAKKN